MTRGWSRPDPSQFPPGIREQIEAANKQTDELAREHGVSIKRRPEQDLQIAIIEDADAWPLPLDRTESWPAAISELTVGAFLYHIPNGGKRSEFEAKIFKAMGVRPGVSDLFFSLPAWCPGQRPAGGMYLECKAGDNTLTDAQAAFLELMRSVGYWTVEVRRVDEYRLAIENYLEGALPIG